MCDTVNLKPILLKVRRLRPSTLVMLNWPTISLILALLQLVRFQTLLPSLLGTPLSRAHITWEVHEGTRGPYPSKRPTLPKDIHSSSPLDSVSLIHIFLQYGLAFLLVTVVCVNLTIPVWYFQPSKLTAGDKIPPYAVLSHTWGPDGKELTYEDVSKGF